MSVLKLRDVENDQYIGFLNISDDEGLGSVRRRVASELDIKTLFAFVVDETTISKGQESKYLAKDFLPELCIRYTPFRQTSGTVVVRSFFGAEIRFQVSNTESFADLRVRAANRWHFEPEEAILSDRNDCVFPDGGLVLELLHAIGSLSAPVRFVLRDAISESGKEKQNRFIKFGQEGVADAMDELWRTFSFYTLQGNTKNIEHLRADMFLRVVKDCRLLSSHLSGADVQLVYAHEAAKAKGSDFGFECFLNSLVALSMKIFGSDKKTAFAKLLTRYILPLARRWEVIELEDGDASVKETLMPFGAALQHLFCYHSPPPSFQSKLSAKFSDTLFLEPSMQFSAFLDCVYDLKFQEKLGLSGREAGRVFLASVRHAGVSLGEMEGEVKMTEEAARGRLRLSFPQFVEALGRTALVLFPRTSTGLSVIGVLKTFLQHIVSEWAGCPHPLQARVLHPDTVNKMLEQRRSSNRSVGSSKSERAHSGPSSERKLIQAATLFQAAYNTMWRSDGCVEYLTGETFMPPPSGYFGFIGDGPTENSLHIKRKRASARGGERFRKIAEAVRSPSQRGLLFSEGVDAMSEPQRRRAALSKLQQVLHGPVAMLRAQVLLMAMARAFVHWRSVTVEPEEEGTGSQTPSEKKGEEEKVASTSTPKVIKTQPFGSSSPFSHRHTRAGSCSRIRDMAVCEQIDGILGRRVVNGRVQYKVDWSDAQADQDDWIWREELLLEHQEMVELFELEQEKNAGDWGDSGDEEQESGSLDNSTVNKMFGLLQDDSIRERLDMFVQREMPKQSSNLSALIAVMEFEQASQPSSTTAERVYAQFFAQDSPIAATISAKCRDLLRRRLRKLQCRPDGYLLAANSLFGKAKKELCEALVHEVLPRFIRSSEWKQPYTRASIEVERDNTWADTMESTHMDPPGCCSKCVLV